MTKIPENSEELTDFILNDVLYGLELDPIDSERLLLYMRERHEHLFGPHSTYFVLGSYESPFKYRLDEALDVLNHRHDAYAYLLATQPDLDVSDAIPNLKVKFFLHALYADSIPLLLEHDTGGAIAEFGRVERPVLLDRTYLFPRAQEEHYDDESLLTTQDAILARAVELAYRADDLDKELAALATQAREHGLDISTQDLESYLESELGGRTPSYSGVITDSLVHLESLDQCFSWTTTAELEDRLSNVP
ncbi:hypothetical protein [Natronorubrum sulfidifaciens]|uniref:Uncharacterized protein n=1 Tax=Natronorubrum sulfidifaciens JCM 14089 TaxID=1230460 RepID=L9W7Z2_9EURY|nr:hypothetical protein [Natronorubrum sulfidifaciens]ELY45376.1 hypothetical protein C495_08220 [Natronorubrum sulfidifaciens JCM 14089]